MTMDKVGERRQNNQGQWMTIIAYRKYNDIDVKFDSGYIAEHKGYNHFQKGSIKDLFYPTVCGVGYVGGTKYSFAKDYGAYEVWRHMLFRCYRSDYKSYSDCEVCKEWHNFQAFAEWFYKNYYRVPNVRMELDKDLIKRTRIYSPDTCCFLPNNINTALVYQPKKRSANVHSGVFYAKDRSHPYETYAYFSDGSRKKMRFITERSAFLFYSSEKERYIKELAERYKEYLPDKVYQAMLGYKYKAAA